MNERIKELEEKLDEVCGMYEDNCDKCPYSKECEEYAHLYSEEKERKSK